jgi:S-adenosylmethionine synthetase
VGSFASESVAAGHPDKLADRISDTILDALLQRDPEARVAVETMVSRSLTMVAGEVTALEIPPIAPIIKDVWPRSKSLVVDLKRQSPEIASGVDGGGAGDQGFMVGYATDETPEFMPLGQALANRLTRRMSQADGKAQVVVEYDDDHRPVRIDSVVVSMQHSPAIKVDVARQFIRDSILKPELANIPRYLVDKDTRLLINPAGPFTVGGPDADVGLTGRKIVVDSYGGAVPHGGGAFSGKDPTKVDRSAAYMARYVAKNIVAAGLARRCQVTLAYVIGVADPVMVSVDTFGTGRGSDGRLSELVRGHFRLTPSGIIETLDLRRPIYQATAVGGHFGREAAEGYFPWERLDKAEALKI